MYQATSLTKFCFALLAMMAFAVSAAAEVRLPGVLSDHMVLQRDQHIRVWGWAEAGEKVVVQFCGDRRESVAEADGSWSVLLNPMPAGGPHTMEVSGSQSEPLVIQGVLIGEVWVCSGQSNMQLSFQDGAIKGDHEVASADHPQIRLLDVPRRSSSWAQEDVDAKWAACSPETFRSFSAIGYFFGLELHRELGVPIGLIASNYSGTPCESWASRSSLEAEPALQPLLDRWDNSVATYDAVALQADFAKRLEVWKEQSARAKADGTTPPRRPTPPPHDPSYSPERPSGLYNAMIAPLANFAIAGVIWYQGESNVDRAYQYRTLFPTMIRGWRDAWEQPRMPFYFVQISPYDYGEHNQACAELWEAQLLTMKTVPHTGMAVNNDFGHLDMHPQNKKIVGHRLALWARARTYGQTKLPHSGPIYKTHQVNGNKVVIRFDHVYSGLTTRDGKPPSHFTVAGSDRSFRTASAKVVGETIVVWSDQVAGPVAVRFAWDGTAEPNLINREGLPATSFRTDNWDVKIKRDESN